MPQSMEWQKVRHDLATEQQLATFSYVRFGIVKSFWAQIFSSEYGGADSLSLASLCEN